MKLKHTFHYRGRKWRVCCVSQRELRALAGARSELAALCDSENARLYYDSRLTPRQRRYALWHELFHAVDDEAKIGLTHAQVDKLERELGGLVRLTFRRP